MIYIIDRFVEGHQHVLANVNVIKILEAIYPTREKEFVAEKAHGELVLSHFESSPIKNLRFRFYKNSKNKSNAKFEQLKRVLGRLIKDCIYFIRLFKHIKKTDSESLVFIAHVYPFSLLFLKVIKKAYPQIRVILFVHGEVEYVFYGKTHYEKFIGALYNFTFKLKASNFHYLFLTKVSKKILLKSRKLKENEIMSIILPTFSEKNLMAENKVSINSPLKVGHIGSAGMRKNVQLLYQIASTFNAVLNKKIEFYNVGPIEENLQPYINTSVIDFVGGKSNFLLDRNVFDSEVLKLDYVMFFYGKHDFVLRSSAAVFDAVYFEKPIIVLKNDFFDDIFREAGNIGFLCNDVSDIKRLLEDMINDRNRYLTFYEVQRQNVITYKDKLNFLTVAEDLSAQMNILGFKK